MRRAMVVAVMMAALCVPATAAADDSSVYGAYVSRDADFAKLGKQLKRGLRAWKASHYESPGQALSAIQETHKVLGEVTSAIDAEQPSSDDGKRGKAAALASVKALDRSVILLSRGIKARTAGHRARAAAFARKSDRQLARSIKAEKTARRAFRAAGVQVKP
jgi:ATP/maltotriose-dependent transcriptional regulator MalT